MTLPSLFFIFFSIIATTQSNPILLSTIENDTLHESTDDSWKSDASSCNSSCTTYGNKICQINKGFCYIGEQCYKENQTQLDDSFSCLRCLPSINQTQWSFNEDCSATHICTNDALRSRYICSNETILQFYKDPEGTVMKSYNFKECGRDPKQCQAGFFRGEDREEPYACCPGHFCPEGQVCMIPCRRGAFCPSRLKAVNGICQTEIKCPTHQPNDFGQYGCGGSTMEGYCPAESYCRTPGEIVPCKNSTIYCPTGVQEPLPCPSGFVCLDGRARRQRLITSILVVVLVLVLIFVLGAEISQWLVLKKKVFGQHELVDPPGVSNYFRERKNSSRPKQQIQLHIHLNQAKLRNVTRFNPELNQGFTGRITAGKITALMGGSGCGKSSLLETIHGRRQLRPNGFITFAEHEPLSNILTDYVGYVPQADIMHEDLTVFETVYYSARTRRLNESKQVIINDVCFVLEKLGLKHLHNSMTKTLSGGQRKRVNVAMEVAACPKVILLDEPTSGLDTVSCDDLFDLLNLIKYSADGPVTIITVIHQPSQELFEKIDDIFFLTPLCCLAYQGPREKAKEYLKKTLFLNSRHGSCPPSRHNDCDTCFIMLIKAQEHVDNHTIRDERISQELITYSWRQRFFLPFFYVLSRCVRQTYVRGAMAEAAYLLAYFLLGTCIGYLFENKQQGTCDILSLPQIYFLISLAFGILTCISSQRLFGVETTDHTFERESRNYFHPFQYWLAKSLVDIFRLLLYPLLFLSIFYVELVPRGPFSFYYGVMILLSFVCSGIGQLTSVIFNRTEYSYLAGTIVALVSCLLSGFSPRKSDLGRGQFIVAISFSRHVQHLLFRRETALYATGNLSITHIWGLPVEIIREVYSFSEDENPYFWLIFIGLLLRGLTFIFLYGKSEYRSKIRFHVTNAGPTFTSLFTGKPCRKRSSRQNNNQLTYSRQNNDNDDDGDDYTL